jgi:YD repeat-containing protein
VLYPHRDTIHIAKAIALLLALLLVTFTGIAHAAQERYDYDSLGRLVRVIDEQGRTTQYIYDPSGNILQIITDGGAAQPPSIATISVSEIRQNRSKSVQITGSGFNGLRLSTSQSGLRISNLSITSTSVSFTLAAFRTTSLGSQAITLETSAGTTQAAINVLPEITYLLRPTSLLPPDNIARQFELQASEVDTEIVTVAVSTLNTAVARAEVAAVTFPIGQTLIPIALRGVTSGNTALSLGGAQFSESFELLILVSADASTNAAYSKPLGVVKGNPAEPAVSSASGPLLSVPLGVVKGNPAEPAVSSASGPLLSVPLGVVKGNPADPSINSPSGPLLSAPLGVSF